MEDIQITNKQMKGCSTLLIIREMQIKTTMRYHLTPIRMAIIKNTTNRVWPKWKNRNTLSSPPLLGTPILQFTEHLWIKKIRTYWKKSSATKDVKKKQQ